MSKSLSRVRAALHAAALPDTIMEVGAARTAPEAAGAAGCALDQIVKSILFAGENSDSLFLFLTAGGNQVSAARATALAGQTLGRADATAVRRITGFAIGGVAPIGHLSALPVWADPRLLAFPTVWAAAGTPRHIFSCDPRVLMSLTGATLADFTQ
ncbi:YbaK/EbsC family protein [Roseicitreum antarcticum]|uniref:Cys-tRNA(Pro) deacylase, prolyl-tRNA editing enzyme YbaK/EbsC n=1 Tax=Roseicitreum antarcticum TaxID=564137 RepID=A0A1H3C859_9RHOB|nr:YbaK/EbsC family protein [Roseicitreum antarcticum]SDX50230.1 Cys-tRNA(Pro) deacylase, prolyl-tRNA editing enzyme YbaK/EbsC [Roseicitreum antarcticum]